MRCVAALPFLFVTDFLSIIGLSLERGAFLTTVRRAVRDELLELEEYDEPDSDPLESDEPVKVLIHDTCRHFRELFGE